MPKINNMLIISIVIVNWNSKKFLAKCLDFLKANTNSKFDLEIIVVDNNSSDDSVSMIKERYKEVKLIENKENLGFARANNQAIKRATGDYILLLNPDTEIYPDSINTMAAFLEKNHRTAMVGPKIFNTDGTVQYECARHFPTPLSEFAVETTLYKRFPKSRFFGSYLMTYWNHDNLRPVDCISGACMLIKTDVIREIQMFDESYFMYGEDVDLCMKIKRHGYDIWFLPEAKIIHHWGKSSEQLPLQMSIIARESMLLYFRKNFGLLTALAYKTLLFIAAFCILTGTLLLYLLSSKQRRKQMHKIIKKSYDLFLWLIGLKSKETRCS